MDKKILIGVGLLVIAILAYLFKDKWFKSAIASQSPTGNPNAGSNVQYLIKQGSENEKVRFLQAYMRDQHNKENLMVDGIWGSNTQAAFKRLTEKVDAFGSPEGLTKDEYKYIAPHEAWLRQTYFTRK